MCVVKALKIFLMKQRLVDLAGKHTILVCVWVKWRRILITQASKTTFSNSGVVLSNWFLQSISCAMPLSHLGNYEPESCKMPPYPINTVLFFFVSFNSPFAFISIGTPASSSFIQPPKSTSLALPLYTIFTNKILTVSKFLKEHNYVITLLTSSSKEIHLAYSLKIFSQSVNCLFILLFLFLCRSF